MNDLHGIIFLMLFSLPIASANLECRKHYKCVNATTFNICGDFGDGNLRVINGATFSCPPGLVCDENNINECHFPEFVTHTVEMIVTTEIAESNTSTSGTSVASSTSTTKISANFDDSIISTTMIPNLGFNLKGNTAEGIMANYQSKKENYSTKENFDVISINPERNLSTSTTKTDIGDKRIANNLLATESTILLDQTKNIQQNYEPLNATETFLNHSTLNPIAKKGSASALNVKTENLTEIMDFLLRKGQPDVFVNISADRFNEQSTAKVNLNISFHQPTMKLMEPPVIPLLDKPEEMVQNIRITNTTSTFRETTTKKPISNVKLPITNSSIQLNTIVTDMNISRDFLNISATTPSNYTQIRNHSTLIDNSTKNSLNNISESINATILVEDNVTTNVTLINIDKNNTLSSMAEKVYAKIESHQSNSSKTNVVKEIDSTVTILPKHILETSNPDRSINYTFNLVSVEKVSNSIGDNVTKTTETLVSQLFLTTENTAEVAYKQAVQHSTKQNISNLKSTIRPSNITEMIDFPLNATVDQTTSNYRETTAHVIEIVPQIISSLPISTIKVQNYTTSSEMESTKSSIKMNNNTHDKNVLYNGKKLITHTVRPVDETVKTIYINITNNPDIEHSFPQNISTEAAEYRSSTTITENTYKNIFSNDTNKMATKSIEVGYISTFENDVNNSTLLEKFSLITNRRSVEDTSLKSNDTLETLSKTNVTATINPFSELFNNISVVNIATTTEALENLYEKTNGSGMSIFKTINSSDTNLMDHVYIKNDTEKLRSEKIQTQLPSPLSIDAEGQSSLLIRTNQVAKKIEMTVPTTPNITDITLNVMTDLTTTNINLIEATVPHIKYSLQTNNKTNTHNTTVSTVKFNSDNIVLSSTTEHSTTINNVSSSFKPTQNTMEVVDLLPEKNQNITPATIRLDVTEYQQNSDHINNSLLKTHNVGITINATTELVIMLPTEATEQINKDRLDFLPVTNPDNNPANTALYSKDLETTTSPNIYDIPVKKITELVFVNSPNSPANINKTQNRTQFTTTTANTIVVIEKYAQDIFNNTENFNKQNSKTEGNNLTTPISFKMANQNSSSIGDNQSPINKYLFDKSDVTFADSLPIVIHNIQTTLNATKNKTEITTDTATSSKIFHIITTQYPKMTNFSFKIKDISIKNSSKQVAKLSSEMMVTEEIQATSIEHPLILDSRTYTAPTPVTEVKALELLPIANSNVSLANMTKPTTEVMSDKMNVTSKILKNDTSESLSAIKNYAKELNNDVETTTKANTNNILAITELITTFNKSIENAVPATNNDQEIKNISNVKNKETRYNDNSKSTEISTDIVPSIDVDQQLASVAPKTVLSKINVPVGDLLPIREFNDGLTNISKMDNIAEISTQATTSSSTINKLNEKSIKINNFAIADIKPILTETVPATIKTTVSNENIKQRGNVESIGYSTVTKYNISQITTDYNLDTSTESNIVGIPVNVHPTTSTEPEINLQLSNDKLDTAPTTDKSHHDININLYIPNNQTNGLTTESTINLNRKTSIETNTTESADLLPNIQKNTNTSSKNNLRSMLTLNTEMAVNSSKIREIIDQKTKINSSPKAIGHAVRSNMSKQLDRTTSISPTTATREDFGEQNTNITIRLLKKSFNLNGTQLTTVKFNNTVEKDRILLDAQLNVTSTDEVVNSSPVINILTAPTVNVEEKIIINTTESLLGIKPTILSTKLRDKPIRTTSKYANEQPGVNRKSLDTQSMITTTGITEPSATLTTTKKNAIKNSILTLNATRYLVTTPVTVQANLDNPQGNSQITSTRLYETLSFTTLRPELSSTMETIQRQKITRNDIGDKKMRNKINNITSATIFTTEVATQVNSSDFIENLDLYPTVKFPETGDYSTPNSAMHATHASFDVENIKTMINSTINKTLDVQPKTIVASIIDNTTPSNKSIVNFGQKTQDPKPKIENKVIDSILKPLSAAGLIQSSVVRLKNSNSSANSVTPLPSINDIVDNVENVTNVDDITSMRDKIQTVRNGAFVNSLGTTENPGINVDTLTVESHLNETTEKIVINTNKFFVERRKNDPRREKEQQTTPKPTFSTDAVKETTIMNNTSLRTQQVKPTVIDNTTPIKDIMSHTESIVSRTKKISEHEQKKVESTTVRVYKPITESKFSCLHRTQGLYADSDNCITFYICTGGLIGKPEVKQCANGTVFSEIRKQCTKNLSHCIRRNEFQCLDEGRFDDIFTDNYYYICVKHGLNKFVKFKFQCQDNFHLDKTIIKCVRDDVTQNLPVSKNIKIATSTTPVSTYIDAFRCTEEGKFANPHDCRKYYDCSEKNDRLRKRKRKCGSDEVFHKDKQRCVNAESYECDASEYNVTSRTTEKSAQKESLVTISNFDCRHRNPGKYVNDDDCKTYYLCIGKRNPIIRQCEQSEIFSEITKQCTKDLSHCIRRGEFQCKKEGRFLDVLRTNYYYICAKKETRNFLRFTLQCQRGFNLDNRSIKCVRNEDTSGATNNEERNDEVFSERYKDNFECDKEGKYPDSSNCSRYYECSLKNGRMLRKKKKCKSDEVFDRDKKKCVSAESYECDNDSS